MSELSHRLAIGQLLMRSSIGAAPQGLPVSRPEDVEEREADSVADRIMRSADDSCECGGTCEHCAGGSTTIARASPGPVLQRDPLPPSTAPGPANPADDVQKPRDQPSQFPPQEQPKAEPDRTTDLEDKLKKGAGKAGGQALSLGWDEFSKSWLGKRVSDGMEQDPVVRFFTKTPLGVVSIIALGAGGLAAGLIAEWTGRDPGAPGSAPKDEKITSLQFTWDLSAPPTAFTLKTPWLDTPTVPKPKPAPEAPLGEPPQLLKVTARGPRICTPTSDNEPEGTAFIYMWLRRNRELADQAPRTPQLHPPPMGPSPFTPMFSRADGPVVAPDGAAINRGLSSPGSVLNPADRAFMERRFGGDFGHVRVHSGAEATAAAASVNANAFTVGHDVVFGAGKYAPGAAAGRRLLAHELAHVVGQQTVAAPTVRRSPDGTGGPVQGGTSGGGGASGSYGGGSAGGGSAAGTSTDPYTVELKGHPRFLPSADLGVTIRAAGEVPTMVRVKFGKVAVGEIPVYWGTPAQPAWAPAVSSPPTGYQTPPPPAHYPAWGIPLVHPAFPALPDAVPMLWVRVRDSVVTGGMGWLTAAQWADDPQLFKANVPIEQLFGGMGDFENFKITGAITEVLADGKFRYIAEGLQFDCGAFHGSGSLSAIDESYELNAGLDVAVSGLPAGARVPVQKKTTSVFDTVSATKTWRFDRAIGGKSGGRLTGSLTGRLSRGSVDVRGTLRYANRSPKIAGTITVVVGGFDVARDAVLSHLGADAPSVIEPAAPGETIAVTGWGQLDFAVTDWLTGNAEVVVHPEGWVTARGEALPTVVIGLFRQRQKDTELASFDPPGVPITGIPGVGDVRAEISAKLFAYGSIGPGALHDLRLTGLISNHPAIVNRFDFGGTMSAPAVAGLRLRAKVGVSGKFLHIAEVAAVSINGTGELELQMYAEAAALAGRRASTVDPAVAEYFLKGKLEAAAELLLRLKLGLSGKVALWEPKLDLDERAWSLGSGAVQANFEYVLGRKDGSSFSVDFGKVDFDASKFASAVLRGETLESKGFGGKKEVGTTTTSEVAAGPQSPALPGPPSAATPPTTGAKPPELEEQFDMLGEPHTLRLDMLGEPDLYMQSRTPTALLGRITRVRRALKKSAPDPEQLAAQLADLDVIEQQAKQVLQAAGRLGKDAPYLTPSVPGFKDLAALIAGYAVRFHASDLEVMLGAVSVDPTKPETILNKFPKLAADALAVGTVSRILANGVPAQKLRKIVDNHQPREQDEVEKLLLRLDLLMAHQVLGWEKIIDELAIGGNMMRGASWVLKYIDDFGSWTDLSLEVNDPDAANPSARRWDAWMNGKLYEFKWWYAWTKNSSRTFLRQILRDYHPGQDLDVRWVFGPSPLPRAEILEQMTNALDTVKADLLAGREPLVDGYTPAVADFIKSRLESVVVKVTS